MFAVLAGIGVALFLGSLLGLRETLPPGQRETGGLRATARTFRALLGVAQFALGGAAAPLAGIAGPGTAVPMALSIAVLAVLAAAVPAVAARPRQVASRN
ncbi:hypothetical protein [Actinomadura monticuli]|uniref:MFS transporter n=1 Tax=Actinomadura monticuli TaxID=3097367 RepID=A0ABV4Q781_9ACTN